MFALGVAALILGGVVSIVAGLILMIAAFRTHVLWGLACLFVPFASLVFLCMHWSEVRGAFLSNVAGTGIALLGLFAMLDATPGGMESLFGQPAKQKESSELTVEIQEQRDRIEKLEARFAVGSAEVIKAHQDLTQRRAALKAGDDAAAAKFNSDAAVYQAKNASQKALKGEIDLAHVELDRLLSARSKTAVAGAASSRVVMYSTKTCPYCVEAKSYFARKGVPYEDRDIQESAFAREEYKRLGGRGVPLILVGSERLDGFSEQRLDQLLHL